MLRAAVAGIMARGRAELGDKTLLDAVVPAIDTIEEQIELGHDVPEMLKGIALANPDTLKYVPDYNLSMRSDAPRDDKVSVIQGSGPGMSQRT